MLKSFLIKIAILLVITTSIFVIYTPILANSVLFTSNPNFYVTAGSSYSYKIAATSTNGDGITYSFQNLPSWLHFDSSSQILSGTTTQTGTYQINIIATDNKGQTDQQNFLIYVNPSVTPTNTPKPTQSVTPTPSLSPTPSITNTPSTTPTSNISTTPSGNKILLYDLQPGNNATITDKSPTISAKIKTGFSIDKKSLNVFFDNNDVTDSVSLATTNPINGEVDSFFSYKTKNLPLGKHTINLTITNPDGIIIPENWSFNIATSTTSSTKMSSDLNKILNELFSKEKTGVFILGLILLAVLIIIGRLLRKRSRIIQNSDTSK